MAVGQSIRSPRMPVFTSEDKRMSLAEAASIVQDGMTIAIGGGLSWREPMALLRELVRQGRRNLRAVGTAHGVDVDLLCGAGVINIVEESYIGFEQDFGMRLTFVALVKAGECRYMTRVAIQSSSNCELPSSVCHFCRCEACRVPISYDCIQS